MRINIIENLKGAIFGLIVALIFTPFLTNAASMLYDVYSVNSYFNSFSDDNLNYINDYFNENYSNGNYAVFVSNTINNNNVNLYLFNLDDIEVNTFTDRMGNLVTGISITSIINGYKYDLKNNTLEITDSRPNNIVSFYLSYLSMGFPIWSSKIVYWKDFVPSSYQENFLYISDYSNLDERYKNNYSIEYINMSTDPMYTLIDLVGIESKPKSISYTINYYFDNVLDLSKVENKTGLIGDIITEYTDYSSDKYYLIENDYKLILSEENNVLNIFYESYKRVNYKIEYYFDDVLKEDYTEVYNGLVNDVITNFIDYSSDIYTLVENEYTLELQEDSEMNVMRVYYRSSNYGTKYQMIDTKNSKIPFIFQFSDIKEMFSGVNFDIFTQFEQLCITIFINLWFVGIFSFITWLFLKMIYKVFQLFV